MAEPGQAPPHELVTLYLQGRDVPCPACGYNRRNGTTTACPECATPIDIGPTISAGAQLNAPRTARLAWILLAATAPEVIALLISAGHTVFLLVSGNAVTTPTQWIWVGFQAVIIVILLITARSCIALLARLRRQTRTPPEHGRHLYRIALLLALASIPTSLLGIASYTLYFMGFW
jgi:hypothetical protein